MPVPGYGQEKRLGKIRAELSSGGYENAPYSSAPTKLDEAENGEYGTINTTTLSGNSAAYPVPSNPAAISEWDNYDHTLAQPITGCMDGGDTAFGVTVGGVPANNYNPEATIPGDCIYNEGCSDPNASNYNPTVTLDDGSCIAVVNGCTYDEADNYNSSANTDDGSCVINIYGCADPLAENYPFYSTNQANLAVTNNYAANGFIQILNNDPDLCTYAAVIVDGDIDNDGLTDLYVGLNPVGFTFSSELDNPAFSGSPTNPNLEVGLSTSFRLVEINYGGGPANFIPDNIVTFGASSVNFTLQNNVGTGEGDSFIKKIIVFVSGATGNNPNGSVNLNDGTLNGQGQSIVMYNGETGNYLSGDEGGYVNSGGAVSTFAMVQAYGGIAYLRIFTEPLYGTDDLNSVFANPDNQYTSDDSNIGYFRQVYFKFHWGDMMVDSESQDNIYQPTCYPYCDPPIQPFGCVEMEPSGDSNDSDDYDCPVYPFEMLWPVKQVFAQIEPTSDDGDSSDFTEDDNSTTADENDTSSAGGGRPSDARWKKNIKRVGTSKLGLPIFEFEYIDSNHGEGKWIGTIAQELIKKNYAHATNMDKNGFYSVDYDKIDIEFKSNKKEDK